MRRPKGSTDEEVSAVGLLSEAVEWVERARGALYEFHQKSGRADHLFGRAAHELRESGHVDLADRLDRYIVGRNVLEGRWTFQLVEEYDATYWSVVRSFLSHVESEVFGGATHVHESELKRARHSEGEEHHGLVPPSSGIDSDIASEDDGDATSSSEPVLEPEQVHKRAELLAVERAAGIDDPTALARQVLRESEERRINREPVERRTSEDSVGGVPDVEPDRE